MFAKILVALDDTALSTSILEEAIEMAQKMNAQLMLMHVLTPLEVSPLGLNPGGLGIEGFFPILNEQSLKQYSEEWKTYESHGMAKLQEHLKLAADRGVEVECNQSAGDPGQSICQAALDWDADLILMGRNRKSGLTELFLGSTSNYVMHHAPCSVLVVQSPVADPVQSQASALS